MSQTASQIRPIVEVSVPCCISKPGRDTQRRLYIAALVLSDALMLGLAFALAYWTRFRVGLPVFDLEVPETPVFYARTAAVFIAVWLVLLALFRAYDWENLLGGTREYGIIGDACTVATMVTIAAGFIWPNFVVARGWLLAAWLLTIACTASARFWLRRVVYQLRRHGYFVTPALIVGLNDEARALAQQLTSWTTSGLEVLGFVDDHAAPGLRVDSRLTVLSNVEALPSLIERFGVEEIIVASSAITPATLLEIFRQYGADERVNVRLSSGLFDIVTTGLSVKSMGYVPLIGINKVRLSRLEAVMKTALDYVGALCGLLFLSPLLAAIAIAIKLDSRGPAIYRRQVLGRGGTLFDAYKFRTMHVNGDSLLNGAQRAALHSDHKLKNDPRITRVGHFLRKTSLDELPQLLNVLKGQMSLVGPRMITAAERDKYGKWDMNLLTVKPGLSGLWQVSGRSDVSYEERVRFDMYYIRNYSIWLDLQILLSTVQVVLKGKGAY